MQEPFDKDELLEQIDGDREFLSETLEIFNEDSPALLEELQRALAQADSNAFRTAAHTLKGMLGNFCAPAAFETASRLEQMGNQADLSHGPETVAAMENEIARLKSALEVLLSTN